MIVKKRTISFWCRNYLERGKLPNQQHSRYYQKLDRWRYYFRFRSSIFPFRLVPLILNLFRLYRKGFWLIFHNISFNTHCPSFEWPPITMVYPPELIELCPERALRRFPYKDQVLSLNLAIMSKDSIVSPVASADIPFPPMTNAALSVDATE